MKTGADGKEIEIIELTSMQTTGAVPPEVRFKVVFEYREKDSNESEGGINETKLFNGGKTLES